MLTVAVVSSDASSSDYLRACLQQTGLVRSVVEWGVSSKGEWRLPPGEKVPEIVLLDLTRDVEPFFEFAAHLRRVNPSARIIASAAVENPDPNLLLHAMRSGVQEFLRKPLNPAKLQETLSRFLQETRADGARLQQNKALMVVGSKGGVGTSTVAVNLAVQVTHLTKKRVVLLDFARPVGHVALLLDLQPRFTIRDSVENIERLDGHFLSGLLTRHKSGLEVLPGAAHPEEWQQIPVASLSRVVNLAQSVFDYVVVDFGSHYSAEWNPTLRLARMILMVAEANVPSLWTLERQMSAAATLGLESDKLRIIINRWSRDDEVALKSVEKNVKRPIFARLPNDFRQVSEAVNLGVPLHRNHNNALVSAFRQLASNVTGVTLAPSPARRAGLDELLFALRPARSVNR
jgi:pilus assembly protein CpaE